MQVRVVWKSTNSYLEAYKGHWMLVSEACKGSPRCW